MRSEGCGAALLLELADALAAQAYRIPVATKAVLNYTVAQAVAASRRVGGDVPRHARRGALDGLGLQAAAGRAAQEPFGRRARDARAGRAHGEVRGVGRRIHAPQHAVQGERVGEGGGGRRLGGVEGGRGMQTEDGEQDTEDGERRAQARSAAESGRR